MVSQISKIGDEMSEKQLEAINANLNKIANLLSPEIPGVEGVRHYTPAGALFQRVDNMSRQVQEIKDAITPGKPGVKFQGTVDEHLVRQEKKLDAVCDYLKSISEKLEGKENA